MSAIEDRICEVVQQRAARGLAKYGVDMTRADLTRAEWLRHAQDEALDLAVYLERTLENDGRLQAHLARAARIEAAVRLVLTWTLAKDVRAALEAAIAGSTEAAVERAVEG